jgi:2-oxo-4-hydroxy-4-carboxy-5-ureidoimidazoline decarboxylase
LVTEALTRFNALPASVAAEELTACCAAPAWGAAMVAGRPYPDVPTATTAGVAAVAALDWAQLAQSLAAHPRIGELPAGERREERWSRREQADVALADERVRTELAEANQAYEERFGHVFLIFASGRTEVEILAAARQRLANDPDTERTVVRGELERIVALRLTRLLS